MTNIEQLIHILLSNFLSADIRRKILLWLIRPRMQEEKAEILFSHWNETPAGADESTFHSYRQTWKKINAEGKKASRPKFARIWKAAIFLIPLISAAAAYLYVENYKRGMEQVECIVPYGNHRTLTLPDGSRVNLNAGSILIYPRRFSGQRRTVFLSGEGNFSVAKNPRKPFIVATSHLSVEAVGTKFNVNAYPQSSRITTTLESGAVRVSKTGHDDVSYLLKPKQQLEYDPLNDTFRKRIINPNLYSGWTKGELNFIQQPLTEILSVLEREYNVKFIVSLPHIPSDLYTIKFRQRDDINKIMNIVTLTVGKVNYRIEADRTITLYASNSKKKGGKE